VVYSLNFVYNTKILCKINQAAKQASKPNDFGQASQASKLKVSKIASQQAKGPQLGLLACYQLWIEWIHPVIFTCSSYSINSIWYAKV